MQLRTGTSSVLPTFAKWQETAKLAASKDKTHNGKGYGEVFDGITLVRLYQELQGGDLNRAEKKQAKHAKLTLAKPALRTPACPSRVNHSGTNGDEII